MTLGNKIAQCRKALSITQDALAQQLGVTNQAVSKWESDQCCPDVTLLPKLANIFGITMDELFGREAPPAKEEQPKEEPRREKSGFEKLFGISLEALDAKANQKKCQETSAPAPLSWPDDNVLRVAVYVGHKMVCGGKTEKDYVYSCDRNVDGVLSCISVSCGDVRGNVNSGRDVTCGNVLGHVDAGCDVNCGNVEGNVDAGCNVRCSDVAGSVDAGSGVHCGNVGGDVDAGADVKCGDVSGDVDAGSTVSCGIVNGDIDAGGSVTIRK